MLSTKQTFLIVIFRSTSTQQNLVEHFKTILKVNERIGNRGEDDGTVMRMYEEALVTVVKSLVSNDEDYVGQRVSKMNSEAESLQNYLSDRISSEEDCPALENEDNNNVV